MTDEREGVSGSDTTMSLPVLVRYSGANGPVYVKYGTNTGQTKDPAEARKWASWTDAAEWVEAPGGGFLPPPEPPVIVPLHIARRLP